MEYVGPEAMKLVVAAVARGTDPAGLAAVLDRAGASARLPRRVDDAFLERLWHLAHVNVSEGRSAVEPAVAALERAADQPWTGASGGTDLAVLRALCALARRHGRLPVAAPVRELALGAAVAPSTVRRSLARLVADGWLVRTGEATYQHAAVYGPGPLAGRVQPRCEPVRTDLGCDAARHAAVGKTRLRVWDCLGTHPRSTAELAAALGRATGTTRRHLGWLAAAGLAHRDAAGWVRGPVSLELAAAHRGTAGRREHERALLAARRRLRALSMAAAG